MYLIMDHPLCELNKIMQEIPNFPPQGHGRMIRKYVYTSADCDCLYCLYHIGGEKNGGCSLEHCMCLQERIEAGVVMQSERWREATGNISDAQFQRRLPLPVIAFVTGAPYRLSPEGDRFVSIRKRVKPARSLMWLAGFADSRGKVIGVLYYLVVKEHRRPTDKAPSLVQRKK